MAAAGGGAGGAPPSSDKSEGKPTHNDVHGYLATTPKTGTSTGGFSVASSTRPILRGRVESVYVMYSEREARATLIWFDH